MARADLVLNLVRAGKSGNQPLLRQTVEALIAEERAKKHTVLAENLARYLNENGRPSSDGIAVSNRIQNYLIETVPQRSLSDLILATATRAICTELAEEHH